MNTISEPDWKIFKSIRERALQTYCENCLSEFKAIAEKSELTAHERYLEIYKLVIERDETLGNMFNGLSRSKAHWQLAYMRAKGIVDPELIAKLSEPFQIRTKPMEW